MTERNWWCGPPILIEQPAHRALGGQSLKHFIGSKSLQLLASFSGAVKSRMARLHQERLTTDQTFVLGPHDPLRSPKRSGLRAGTFFWRGLVKSTVYGCQKPGVIERLEEESKSAGLHDGGFGGMILISCNKNNTGGR